MDYSRFLNSVSVNRTISPLRKIWVLQKGAGPAMVSLGAGIPNSSCFPFESMTVKTKNGSQFTLEDEELSEALNYNDSRGLACLRDWLKELQRRLHDPPYARQEPELNELIIVPGSEDGQCKIMEMLLEPGDPVLITEPAYPGSLSMLKALSAKMLPVQIDEDGAKPESLREMLEREKSSAKRPKLLITQANHCNPSGASTSVERKKQIYQLACQYDLIIVEDDPYYFLSFEQNNSPPVSLLSLDTQGRVLRLESFSKVVAAGFRIGTVSGPRPLVERVTMHQACSSLHPSTLTQTILYKFLANCGHDGFLDHVKSVASFYESRCGAMLKAAEKHLKGLAEWRKPDGGMFLWIRMFDVHDTEKMIIEKALKKMVMLAPGCLFMCDETRPTSYLRASYSWASDKELDEGFSRLAEMIREEQNRKEG